MNSDKIRAGIYSLAAIYMLYTAMQLYKENNVVATVFFVIAAVGLIVISLIIAKRVTDKEKAISKEKNEDESETAGKRMD